MPSPKEPERPSQRPEHRIAKLLARAGVASRREVERMIAEGRVARDGVALDTPATLLPSLDGVTVDGEPIAAAEPARLFLYHKPPGLLVTERDPAGRPTIYDRLPGTLPRVVPVGRLDLGTEGLLLLTTDGALKRQLELPATGVERAYRARAYGQISQAQLEALIEGIEIEGVRYGSINANLERRTGANVWIEMILTEGKNREVRRVLEHLGLRVSRLIRTRYGPFLLGDLPAGEVGEVRRHDVDSFRKNPTRIDLPQPARARQEVAPIARPASAPRPPHHRASPDGPPPRVSSGKMQDKQPALRQPSRPDRPDQRVASASPPRARLGEGDRAPKARGGTAAGPAGGRGRPARGKAQAAEAKQIAGERRSGTATSPAPDRTETIAKPARAARARSFRETREPRPDAPARAPGPAPGKRDKPARGPARPPRTRK